MTSTVFTDNSTVVLAAWLNDANTSVYTTVPALVTKTANLPTVSAFAGTIMDDVDAASVRATIGAASAASTVDYLNTTRIDVASATTLDLTTNAPNTRNINITGTTTITGVTVAIGQLYFVRFNGALILTNNAAIVTQTGANIQLAAGDTLMLRATAANVVEVLNFVPADPALTVLRSYLAGLTMSTAGASATMSIAAGQSADSTNAVLMTLTAIAKTTSAWAVGTATGGIDTGAIANNTWYHFYVIRRPDTGVVDVVFSLSATSPTLPTNYTQFRRIGSGRTNGSAQWTSFVQYADSFLWLSPVLDISAGNPGTAAVTRTLTTPTGVVTKAVMNVNLNEGASRSQCYLSELTLTDLAVSITISPLGSVSTPATGSDSDAMTKVEVFTNTSSQIRSRLGSSDAGTFLYIATLGWVDTRGRNE